jgi:hypothetical protein
LNSPLALSLLLSLLGLSVGPALVALGRARGRWRAAVEGFSLAVVPGLIALRLLPHVVEELGVVAFALAAAGYGTLRLADRSHHGHGHTHGAKVSAVGAAIVIPALLAHAFTDGAALAMASAAGGRAHVGPELASALVLHRLPEGMFLASALVPALGWPKTLRRLGAMALATLLGAALGESLLRAVPDAVFDGVMAFGLGAMLRLALHTHEPEPGTVAGRRAAGAAFLVGVAAVVLIPDPQSVLNASHPQELSFARAVVALFIETSPAVLLGVLAAVGVRALRRPFPAAWLAVSGRVVQAARGVVFGLPRPMCSCGAVPVARGLLARGAPLSAVLAFIVAAPELDVGAVALATGLLGPGITALRLGMGVLAAMVVAMALGGSDPSGRPHSLPPGEEDPSSAADQIASWFVLGIVAAATLEAAVAPGALASIPRGWSYVGAVLAAMPMYLAPHASIPVAAVLIHKGLGVGPAVCFVMGASGANASVLRALVEARGRPLALRFGAVMIGASVGVGLLVERLSGAQGVPEVHDLAAHHHGILETLSAVTLLALLAGSVLRSGPRRWFLALQPWGDPHDHDAATPVAGAC